MSTTITRWGNSSGVRIPSKVLGASRFKLGDAVDFVVNAHGNIEIIEPARQHRRVLAPGRITAEKLYEQYPIETPVTTTAAWPDEDMAGAEWESWSK